MTRFIAGLSCFLVLCCTAIAQTPVAVPAKSTAPSVAATADSPEVRDFQKIEDGWTDAINKRDQYGLELVLSPLFIDISASGEVSSRNQQLALIIADEDKTLHLGQKVVTVRMLGDVAVASGTYILHHKAGSTQVDEKGVFTHVFERTRGGWLCVNSQRTVLREDTSAKPKKPSTAEMPFHIPLFTRDKDK